MLKYSVYTIANTMVCHEHRAQFPLKHLKIDAAYIQHTFRLGMYRQTSQKNCFSYVPDETT